MHLNFFHDTFTIETAFQKEALIEKNLIHNFRILYQYSVN